MLETTQMQDAPIDQLDPKQFIIIKGARVNNLKGLDVAIPRNKLVVVTGLSGSGKSSLAFDTLFAEGQRMYVESLSSYARQFLGRMEKPEVDYIRGVSPAIAIEQKVNTRNPRSTVGTSTEIYDYLKLLFARIGKTISPVSGKEVKRDSVTDIVSFILNQTEGSRVMILCPMVRKDGRSMKEELNVLLQKGYTRVLYEKVPHFIEDLLEKSDDLREKQVEVLVDRAVVQPDEDTRFRLSDSIQTALFESEGTCLVEFPEAGRHIFSDRFEEDGMAFEEPSVNLFTFNNPFGACKTCEGFGKILGVDPDLVIPDPTLSVYEGAIAPWRSETMRKWLEPLLKNGIHFDFPIHRTFEELTEEEKLLLWKGNKYFKGLDAFFKYLASKTHKIQYRVMLSRYRGKTNCPDCKGTRLRKDANYVKVGEKSISDLVLMPIDQLQEFFTTIKFGAFEEKVASRLLREITNRIDYLLKVGLGYLTLNRLTNSLSGGEFQRIKLATSLGSALVGSMYILDEPSIGLHPRDTERLVSVLQALRDMGNTVIVVEHEEKVMQAADQIIDIGPDAGSHGGELVFQGTMQELIEQGESHTSRFLSGASIMPIPEYRRKWKDHILVKGAEHHNLKRINVTFPLGVLTVVTGVSGSGKSTLIKNILYPAIGKRLGTVGELTGKMQGIEGDLRKITQIELIDQNPIGKSSRSNPVTYVKAYDAIRQSFTQQPLAKQRGYKPAFFSFNVDGGRCETCQGEGVVKIEMQFMADIYLACESCKGQRFKQEILEVTYQDKNIAEVLDLTIDEAMVFFENDKPVLSKLAPLQNVGLGYIRLGQSSNSLSGGEAQRVKLAYFLGKGKSKTNEHILFIFDEPTTGLHYHDISKLMYAINALIEQGNSVIIIEHNTEVMKAADWIIDLGPEGGEKGGQVCFEGTPEDMIKLKENHTSRYLMDCFS